MPSRDDSLAAWLRLAGIPGIGPAVARRLLTEFGLPENIFAASRMALRRIVPESLAHAIAAPLSPEWAAGIDQALQWCAQPGNDVVTLADAHYPPALLEIPDPPILLYVKGRTALLATPALAIVGSRNATVQGARNAENFARALSHAGLTIVSGLALGIDAAAHRGGLQGVGSTVAVIGTGMDIVYPARNRALAHQIAEQGCLVSEYPLGTPALAANFPRRNRLISGLARGVLVVEAAAQSGSLITARLAAEQGKDTFAIPGSIHSPLSKGCHLLIKQGAKLVESAQDILEEWRLPTSHRPSVSRLEPPEDATAAPLLAALGFDPVGLDALCEATGMDAATVNAQLLALELEGRVERLPEGAYRRLV